MNFLSNTISVVLVPLLVASPVWAQAPASKPLVPGRVAPKTTGQLQLRLVDSDGSRVVANTRTAKGIAVQVTDADGAPVSDAAVAFRFSESGASASFADGSHSAVAYTDAGGNAHIANFQWNGIAGTAALRITANKANSHAGLLIEQNLVSGSPVPGVVAPPVSVPSSVPSNEAEAAIPETDAVATTPASIATTLAAHPSVPAPTIPSEYIGNPYHPARLGLAPAISISNTGGRDEEYHSSSRKKWIILGIAAGAGIGIAFALMNAKSATSATGAAASSGVSVGTPTISIGHP